MEVTTIIILTGVSNLIFYFLGYNTRRLVKEPKEIKDEVFSAIKKPFKKKVMSSVIEIDPIQEEMNEKEEARIKQQKEDLDPNIKL